jgi:mannitol-1-phosphate/altronate dehydrogenase
MATNVQELGSKTAIILNRALAQAIQSNDFNKMTKVLKVSTYYLATENNTKDQEKNYDLKVKEFEQKIKESSDDLTYSQLSDEEISKKLVDIVKKIKK